MRTRRSRSSVIPSSWVQSFRRCLNDILQKICKIESCPCKTKCHILVSLSPAFFPYSAHLVCLSSPFLTPYNIHHTCSMVPHLQAILTLFTARQDDLSWAWTDGSAWGFTTWHPNEPNNAGKTQNYLEGNYKVK